MFTRAAITCWRSCASAPDCLCAARRPECPGGRDCERPAVFRSWARHGAGSVRLVLVLCPDAASQRLAGRSDWQSTGPGHSVRRVVVGHFAVRVCGRFSLVTGVMGRDGGRTGRCVSLCHQSLGANLSRDRTSAGHGSLGERNDDRRGLGSRVGGRVSGMAVAVGPRAAHRSLAAAVGGLRTPRDAVGGGFCDADFCPQTSRGGTPERCAISRQVVSDAGQWLLGTPLRNSSSARRAWSSF